MSCMAASTLATVTHALTTALLAELDIHADLAADRLCPAVPSRLNYVHWIEDIVGDVADAHGLDIGTGSVAVYAVLACALHPRWTMVGTDIDGDAIALAEAVLSKTASAGDVRNIAARVELRHTAAPSPLIPDSTFDFVICNPPFYASQAEREQCAADKQTPHEQVAATATELYTPGGEVAFVRQMIDESVHRSVGWATSMVGRLASIGELVAYLRQQRISNYALAEFVQGKTRRWALAWSLGPRRLPDAAARPRAKALARWLPASNERVLKGAPFNSVCQLHEWLATLPTLAPTSVHLVDHDDGVLLTLFERCWTRDARRRRAQPQPQARPYCVCTSHAH
ncbi:23S rRNA (adenine(1618)-N(6))-methyltransferase [Malassezia cuniculi]|uniref:23S rRNA (Adenine(1618)-N(6))-methyltransferase n=1 Tax=Malassezia cuniculi TaxID=948313 RepID=A0AAF0EYP1_9BASI|nr:23S rRNA (adenine(1618)-N(6))-methyltransferase [Malassezia cuniculi]